jgi:DNA polymerase-3 subunit alpha (Gram-positive type)
MSDELKRFFDAIEFYPESELFASSEIEKVVYLKQKDVYEVYLNLMNVLPYKVLKELLNQASLGIKKEKNCVIRLSYNNVSNEDVLKYVKELIKELVEKRPSLINLNDSNITIDDEIITIEVSSKLEELEVKKEGKGIAAKLYSFGLGEYEITSVLNETLHEEIKSELEKDKTKEVEIEIKPSPSNNEKPIEGEVTPINNIIGDMKSIIVEAYIFGIDTLERDTINIITLKISDKTNSLMAKIFKKQKDEYKATLSSLKEGAWYRFQGKVEFDSFSKDLVLSVRKYEEITSKDEVVKDNAEIPRVELHTHTMMSAMDGVIPADAIVKICNKYWPKSYRYNRP